MTTLKELFHAIANWHNKITIAAGGTREILKEKPLTALNKEELKEQQERLVSLLDKLESDAVNANKKVEELREALYQKLKPETQV